ncbi:GRF-interacting factor 1 [Ancistrocladus abbreviatus]
MQQHLMQMQPMMAAYYSNNVTTDHIQQYLDENKSLILKIVESQNSGKLSECAENQARLQRNLMYLAAIADSQPQPSTMHSQYPTGMMQTGAHYMQHQQAQSMTPQALMAARSSMLYSQQPYAALQQQQVLHGQIGMSAGGTSGLNMLHGEANGAGSSSALLSDFGRAATGEGMHAGGRILSKQDIGNAGSADGRGSNLGGHGGECGESLYLKSSDDGN